MNDPIKVIWKYKNDNRRTQYLVYIFIGNVSKSIKKILDKIQNLNLYDTLLQLTKEEYTQLEKLYGLNWYTKFFNLYHINNTIYSIRESQVLKTEIIQKYSQQWYDIHIQNHQLMERKLIYSYESIIKFELERKNKKKVKEFSSTKEAEDFNDYTTTKKLDVKKLFNIKKEQTGGDKHEDFSLNFGFNKLENDDNTDNYEDFKLSGGYDDDHEGDVEDDEEIYHDKENKDDNLDEIDNIDNIDNIDGKKDDNEDNEDDENKLDATEITVDEEVDLNEIEQIYKDSDVKFDENIAKTTDLIKEALNNNKIFEKQSDMMVEFDDSKDKNIYDESLKDIFQKKYIENQFIYKDDTIKSVKDKICISLKNNKKFGQSYLIPSRQYLWTDYYYDNKIEKIMLGQKWLRRNEILSIDIEPNNNLRVYEELTSNLKTLRDNLKRYTSKIRREDDENNILFDYNDYLQYNEIYMIDIYNELGSNYKKDS